jgi:hypothetical protein
VPLKVAAPLVPVVVNVSAVCQPCAVAPEFMAHTWFAVPLVEMFVAVAALPVVLWFHVGHVHPLQLVQSHVPVGV